MLEEILAQADAYVQWLTALLLLLAVLLEIIHIMQTRRINKRLKHAARRLQKYLDTVFADVPEEAEPEESWMEPEKTETVVRLEAEPVLQSRQEKDMRATLKNRKLQQEDELLDTVLQEIFD